MPHVTERVGILRFHSCRQVHFASWQRKINREGYVVTKNTRVCSNHFKSGKPLHGDPHPTLFMRGNPEQSTSCSRCSMKGKCGCVHTSLDSLPKRKALKAPEKVPLLVPAQPTQEPTIILDHCYITPSLSLACDSSSSADEQYNCQNSPQKTSSYSVTDLGQEHMYCQEEPWELDECSASRCTGFSPPCAKCKPYVMGPRKREANLRREIECTSEQNRELTKNLHTQDSALKLAKRFGIHHIQHSDRMIKLHTGLPSYAVFEWLLEQISDTANNLTSYRSSSKDNVTGPNNKRVGRPKALSNADMLLLTLMKLKLNPSLEELSFRFDIALSTASTIFSTWISFLACELKAMIYWPPRDELPQYYPRCFAKFGAQVSCIIDCTEVPIERASLAETNTKTFSSYKNRQTVKCLVACTPAGTISYVSEIAGGRMSDKEIVKRSDFLSKLTPGDVVMADRGFNIQDLLLTKKCRLVIPPFTRRGQRFTATKDARTKNVANARIHIERAIGRMKEFKILRDEMPLLWIDTVNQIFTVCAILVNLQPPIVPL